MVEALKRAEDGHRCAVPQGAVPCGLVAELGEQVLGPAGELVVVAAVDDHERRRAAGGGAEAGDGSEEAEHGTLQGVDGRNRWPFSGFFYVPQTQEEPLNDKSPEGSAHHAHHSGEMR